MFIDAFAVAILGTLVVPIVAVLLAPAWGARPAAKVALSLVPLLALAVLCRCLPAAMGIPTAVWLFPLVGTALAAVFLKNDRGFRALTWSLLALAAVLCLNAKQLTEQGYVLADEERIRLNEALQRQYLLCLGRDIARAIPPQQEFPEAPLEKVSPWHCRYETERHSFHHLWHTSFTGLYLAQSMPGVIWYPGGAVSRASKELQWRPMYKQPSDGTSVPRMDTAPGVGSGE